MKHDIEARKAAIGLFERGHGFESAAKALSVPRDTVRQWLYVYRSFGSEVLLSMDGKQTRYTYEQKVAAASAVVDGGMSGRDAMEALRPKPRGRPKGSSPVSVNLFFTSFAKQARRSRKGGFTGCANVFSPIPVTA